MYVSRAEKVSVFLSIAQRCDKFSLVWIRMIMELTGGLVGRARASLPFIFIEIFYEYLERCKN